MSNQKDKPEMIAEDDLDEVQGGLIDTFPTHIRSGEKDKRFFDEADALRAPDGKIVKKDSKPI